MELNNIRVNQLVADLARQIKIKIQKTVAHPVWHVPDAEEDDGGGCSIDGENLVLDQLYGVRKYVNVSYPNHITSCVSSYADATITSSGVSILTIGWSYILSVRLLELQGETVTYTRYKVGTRPRRDLMSNNHPPNTVEIDLGRPASRQLIAWLRAILAPKAGWVAKGSKRENYTPWAVLLPSDVQFCLYVDEPIEVDQQEHPPTYAEAAQLFSEFCGLFGLGKQEGRPGRPRKDTPKPSPVTLAFLAALALPFYRHLKLQPHFPQPMMKRSRLVSHAHSDLIKSYVKDLSYYMTLSMQPRCVGSIIWSIFRQPEIECSLVSPWLSSISAILKPIIEFKGDRSSCNSLRPPTTMRGAVVAWHFPLWQLYYFRFNSKMPRYA